MSGVCNPVREEQVMLTQSSAAVMPAPLLRRQKRDYFETTHARMHTHTLKLKLMQAQADLIQNG